jgi:hypothetical protein
MTRAKNTRVQSRGTVPRPGRTAEKPQSTHARDRDSRSLVMRLGSGAFFLSPLRHENETARANRTDDK